MPRYGHRFLDFAYDVLTLVWGDPSSRIPKLLIVGGIALIGSPWWLPIFYDVLEKWTGIDTEPAVQFDYWMFGSGWVLVVLGSFLWIYVRKTKSPKDLSQILRDWRSLQERLKSRLKEQLEKEQYKPASDARADFAVAQPVALIYGESGQGKTWRLARLALEAAEAGLLVVWVPASRGTNDPSRYTEREICSHGLELDAELTPRAYRRAMQRMGA